MHSFLSARHQPYQYFAYTIFVAEVASTFNEQLLARHLMDKAKDNRERAYLINSQIDSIRGTIIRQTMFAEFEKTTHALVEAGEPLTVDALRKCDQTRCHWCSAHVKSFPRESGYGQDIGKLHPRNRFRPVNCTEAQ